jgi:tetratricopeptide (TPR) repeat protein
MVECVNANNPEPENPVSASLERGRIRYSLGDPSGPTRLVRPLCVFFFLLFAGCSQMEVYEHDIRSSTRAIESASDDAHRAAAYSKRGSAYSEKARYSRAFKLIPAEEYERLFGLAIKDHERAIALDPTSAEAYYSRGRTYYDRAVLETVVNGALVGTDASRKAWFAPAVADFQKGD